MRPDKQRVVILGETDFREDRRRFGMYAEDRTRHLWAIGKSGTGKSTLLANMIRQDLANGEGLAVIDPHGDLIDEVLPFVPSHRTNDVLLFDPSDREWPVAFNVFRSGKSLHEDPALLASQLTTTFKKFWSDSWGPRLEYVLRNAVLLAAESPRATLLHMYRLLTDEPLRASAVERARDPFVRRFWEKEFPSYGKSLASEALAPALNKLGKFLSHGVVRNIVAQEKNRVDLKGLEDRRGILLAKLPVGTIGEDASHLLGGLLVTGLQLAAMERPRGGATFVLYVDEFQNFVTDSLATLLSEARKFGLAAVLAHQYASQLTDPVREAILGNVGTALCFTIGATDAELLAPEFGPELDAQDLERLEPHRFVVRLLVRGRTSRPFTARSLPPPPPPADAAVTVERVREQSRARHATPRANVERAIEAALAE